MTKAAEDLTERILAASTEREVLAVIKEADEFLNQPRTREDTGMVVGALESAAMLKEAYDLGLLTEARATNEKWDFPDTVDSAPKMRAYLFSEMGMSPWEYKRTSSYRSNVDKIPWLKDV